MATGSGQELDMNRLVVIVLFLIVGGIFFRTFFQNYISEPARTADRQAHVLETLRTSGFRGSAPTPGIPGYERARRVYQYATTGDEQDKQWVIQDAKRRKRAEHSLAIWGSLAVACISIIIIVVIVGLPMLLNRRA